MEMSPKVAFIDDNINIDYLKSIVTDEQTIGGIFTVSGNEIIPSTYQSSDEISHVTLCSKIFLDHISHKCNLFFINIWDEGMSSANINSLIIALFWCLENEIKLINLSIGTTDIDDVPGLLKIINQLVKKNTIIVAASSNKNKMTFPAFFDDVIGVKALESKSNQTGYIYEKDGIDQVNVSCYFKTDFLEYKGSSYGLICSNSLATPKITAEICNFLSEGYESLKEIQSKLADMSIKTRQTKYKRVCKRYFKDKINIPIIAIISNDEDIGSANLFVQEILLKFIKNGYKGVCLNEHLSTDLSKKYINIKSYEGYSLNEKLRYYTHYCNVDYVIIESSKEFLHKNFNGKDIDIILYDDVVHNLKYKKGIEYIDYHGNEDFERIFNKIYECLTSE